VIASRMEEAQEDPRKDSTLDGQRGFYKKEEEELLTNITPWL